MATTASLFALQCPKCGGPVEYDKKADIYSCKYCGISFKLLISGDSNKDFRAQLEKARNAYERKRFQDARKYYQDALDLNMDSWEADFGIASCDMMLSTWQHYSGDEFDSAINEARKKIKRLPSEEQREAFDILAYHIMDAAIFCSFTLWDKVWDAWEYYDNYHDDFYSSLKGGRKVSGYSEKPDVTLYTVERKGESWMAEAAELAVDAPPDDEPLNKKELEIVDFYIFIYDKTKEKKDPKKTTTHKEYMDKRIREKFNKRNPHYKRKDLLSKRFSSYI